MKKLINKYKNWNPSFFSIAVLLLLPFIFFIIYGFVVNNDFWFLINTGKEIVNNGFINIEPFTIHSGLSFIPQQWLIDVLFYFVYNLFNLQGIYYLIVIFNLLIIFLIFKLSYLITNDRKKSFFITFFTDSMFIILGFITTRPFIIDIIILLLELILLESYILKNNKKYLYFIPLLSLLLINSHSSIWLMLFVFMLPYYAEWIVLKIMKQDKFNIKPLMIVTIISLIMGLANPYGIEAIKYLFNSYGVYQINIMVAEMKPLSLTSTSILLYLIILFELYSFYHNKGNNKIRYILLSLGTIFLGLIHFRGLPFFCISFPLIVSYNFKKEVKKEQIRLSIKDKITYILAIIIFLVLILFKVEVYDGLIIKEFADYLDLNASKDITLYTDYNTGGYMEWRGYKCYIDPRAEVFLKSNNKKEDIFFEYYDLENGEIEVNDFIEKYKFDYLLVDGYDKMFMNGFKYNKKYELVLSKEKKYIKMYLYKRVDKNE